MTSIFLVGSLTTCGESVVLRDEDGAFELRYGCGSFQPAAQSTSEHSLVRSYALRAVRFASESGDMDPVRPMMDADAQGGGVELERLVVEYLCRNGALADSLPRPRVTIPPEIEAMRRANRREGELKIGSEAPAFRLPVLDTRFFEGSPDFVSLEAMAGQYVLITFGGPWCPPCVEEQIKLVPIWERFKDRGLSVFAILNRSTPELGWAWIQENIPGAFPTLVDEGSDVASQYGVRGVPRTYLIGPSGDVVQTWLGWGPDESHHMTGALDRLLSQPGAQ